MSGTFEAGEPVSLRDQEGKEIAHGLSNYSSDEIPPMLGKSTSVLAEELGDDYSRELVHVDNLVVLRARGARTKLKK